MTKVIYTGTADFQEFSKADFEKAGVEDQNKVRFAKGEPTEVSDSAAEALLATKEDESIFFDHSFEAADDDEGGDSDTESTTSRARKKAAARSAASASDAGTGSTGAGTSTGGGV